ncbi:ArpU family phage packaging/lysis transcriptional regulator [Margalitia sp. FSL K6-0131]|uniref:ArpU family phage packaging/lysis transcriptional regulator n=1 Tax=Margalitia sp. FSL K6-0131 TaxID=2954604 RepID=UPI0030F4E745
MNIFSDKRINKAATRKRVEQIFEQYQVYKLRLKVEKTPSLSSQIQLVPAFSNSFHSKSETFICKQEEAIEFIKMVEDAVSLLPYEKERELITLRYLQSDRILESEVRDQIMVSERTYYRYKESALIHLAFILQVVVYKKVLYHCNDCGSEIYDEYEWNVEDDNTTKPKLCCVCHEKALVKN